jgi:hypothetical protein
MITEPEHTDVASYVLGLLDEEEMSRFEEHMLTCERCAAEADELMSLPPLLEPLVSRGGADSEPPATAVPSESLLPALLADVAADRTRKRHRRMLALAAAITLIVAGPVIGVVLGHRGGTPATDSVAMDLVMVGEQHKAVNAANGVSAIIGLEPRSWGTHVAIELKNVHGPLTCDLIAVSKTGQTEVVTNWLVPSPGYGVPGNEQPLVVHGAAALNKSQIDHFEVRTLDGQTLITVPV